MNHVGVDLHKETSLFYIVDKNGEKISSKNVLNKPDIIKQYFEQIPKPFILAVEATYNWYHFVAFHMLYITCIIIHKSISLRSPLLPLTTQSRNRNPMTICSNAASFAIQRVATHVS